jgi:hypothetical protein
MTTKVGSTRHDPTRQRVITCSPTTWRRGLDQHPRDPAPKRAAVLALARSGAKARERYLELGELGLGNVSLDDASPSLRD